jgi:hypothetical protein
MEDAQVENGAVGDTPREASVDQDIGHDRELSSERMDED